MKALLSYITPEGQIGSKVLILKSVRKTMVGNDMVCHIQHIEEDRTKDMFFKEGDFNLYIYTLDR